MELPDRTVGKEREKNVKSGGVFLLSQRKGNEYRAKAAEAGSRLTTT
jgi:hypothetical protein